MESGSFYIFYCGEWIINPSAQCFEPTSTLLSYFADIQGQEVVGTIKPHVASLPLRSESCVTDNQPAAGLSSGRTRRMKKC